MSITNMVCLHWHRPIYSWAVLKKYLLRRSRWERSARHCFLVIHMCVDGWLNYDIRNSVSAVLTLGMKMGMVSRVVIHAEPDRTEFPQQVNSNHSVLVVTQGMSEATYLAVIRAVVSSPAPTALEIQDKEGTWLECESLQFNPESQLKTLYLVGEHYGDAIAALLAHQWEELYLNGVDSFREVLFPTNLSSLRTLDIQRCNLRGIRPIFWLASLPHLERLRLVDTGCELTGGVASARNLREVKIRGGTWSESLQEDYSDAQQEFINELTSMRNNKVCFSIRSTGAYNLRLQDMAGEVGIELS